MELKKQQKEAMAAIENFLNSDSSVFILKGYAGSGKTTLISPIILAAESAGKTCQLMAPTGRAAKILSEKTAREAITIHKGIYELSRVETREGNETEESKVEFYFPLRQMDNPRHQGKTYSPDTSLLIVDESSMISSRKTSGDMFIFGSGILLDDLMKYASTEKGGKVIFVGDPAQLPPVGDPDSYALDAEHLQTKGFKVMSYELTDVIRQESHSAILSNSIKLRNLINSEIRTALTLDRRQGEVEDIADTSIPERYCEVSPLPDIKGPVVICYSNKSAAAYNNMIRGRYFPGMDTIQIGDKLIIVGNNYSSESRAILNGEFATVMELSETMDTQEGWVYMDDGTEVKKHKKIELSFRDVTLLFEDGSLVKKKIIDSLLQSGQPNITYQEQCALMSNFRMRNKDLKSNSPEFIKALMSDPYYNALRAKYGYAVTCHKAQGGEWDTTFVDFRGRIGLSKDCLRWSYTAATRARRMMFGHCLHNVPQLTAKVMPIMQSANVPNEYYPVEAEIPVGPFFKDSDKASLKAKYWQVADALEGTGYKVVGVEHMQYREVYSISDADGRIFRCDSMYNGAGILKPFRAVSQSETATEILSLINSAPEYEFPYSYVPSTPNLEDLYVKVKSICDDNSINIVNVVEHLGNFKVAYYLKTDAAFALLDVCVNKFGQITYITPRSEKGSEDGKLAQLVEDIKNR